jgi:hypothetical protein
MRESDTTLIVSYHIRPFIYFSQELYSRHFEERQMMELRITSSFNFDLSGGLNMKLLVNTLKL